MKRVFADTSYWIALFNPRDELHHKAVEASQKFPELATTEMVLVEFLNAFSDRGPRLRAAASRAVTVLRASAPVSVTPQTSEQFERALSRYNDRPDKNWSLTDCASFLMMEAESIEDALTHDQHFVQAGFRALLR
ncbi:MAG TPA: PIN domain-containing protein [Terriglobia bacterium]|nr:PIN domain-containing protein [Terriglobia bacterium]